MDIIDTNWTLQLQIASHVAIAALLGGFVGWEREKAARPAGLRTHAILAAACALLTGLTEVIIHELGGDTTPSLVRADPIRVVEAIATGVSFIGAGTVFRHYKENVVEGLTTAASLLFVAGIGVAVGLKQILLAAIAAVLSWVLLYFAARVMPNKER